MSIEQLVALHDHERRVRRRVCTDNLVLQADGYWKSAYAWLQQTKGSRLSQSDLALAEARRIVEDDGHFISMKIQGALESQLRREEGDFSRFHGDPKELANLALALIERSERAWRATRRRSRKRRWRLLVSSLSFASWWRRNFLTPAIHLVRDLRSCRVSKRPVPMSRLSRPGSAPWRERLTRSLAECVGFTSRSSRSHDQGASTARASR